MEGEGKGRGGSNIQVNLSIFKRQAGKQDESQVGCFFGFSFLSFFLIYSFRYNDARDVILWKQEETRKK